MRDPMGSRQKSKANDGNPNIVKKTKRKSEMQKLMDMLKKNSSEPPKTDGIKEEIRDGNDIHHGEGSRSMARRWCFTLHKPTRVYTLFTLL